MPSIDNFASWQNPIIKARIINFNSRHLIRMINEINDSGNMILFVSLNKNGVLLCVTVWFRIPSYTLLPFCYDFVK